jgi:hypothetical protein
MHRLCRCSSCVNAAVKRITPSGRYRQPPIQATAYPAHRRYSQYGAAIRFLILSLIERGMAVSARPDTKLVN